MTLFPGTLTKDLQHQDALELSHRQLETYYQELTDKLAILAGKVPASPAEAHDLSAAEEDLLQAQAEILRRAAASRAKTGPEILAKLKLWQLDTAGSHTEQELSPADHIILSVIEDLKRLT